MSIFTGSDRPSLKDLFKHVKTCIAPNWFEVGIELLDERLENKLRLLKAEHDKNFGEGCREMLQLWLDSDTNASWDQLIKTLEQPCINEGHLAEKIKQMLKSNGMFIIK